jgi:hypothetical protein
MAVRERPVIRLFCDLHHIFFHPVDIGSDMQKSLADHDTNYTFYSTEPIRDQEQKA